MRTNLIFKKMPLMCIVISIVFLAGLNAEAVVKNKAVELGENKEPGYVYVTTEPADAHIKKDVSEEKMPQYAPDKLIVKFKPKISEVIRKSGCAVQTRGLSQSLNGLNAKYKVKKINSVFKSLHKKGAFGKFLTAENQAQKTADKFSKRQKRAPIDAKTPDLENIYLLELEKDADILQSAADYQNDPNVEYAEPDYIYDTQMVPNDPYYSSSGSWDQPYDDLWGIKKIQCEEAWDISQGEGVVVAVIDTGIDYNHPDIADNIWVNEAELNGASGIDDDENGYIDDVRGWDFVGADVRSPQEDNDPLDGMGHGTHCAGTIAAVGNNEIGVIGVAPKAKVMAVKGVDDHGSGNLVDLANCLVYAADMGADVLSNSWVGPYSKTIENAVDYAHASGCVVVAAAGNEGHNINAWGGKYTPANLKNTIAVAATDIDNQRARFSNWGVGVDIAAPGVDILSLRAEGTDIYGDGQHIVGEKYYRANGTSMACPHISGSAALILSAHPQFTNEDVRQALTATAEPLTDSELSEKSTGYRRANIYKALQIESPLRVEITYPIDDPFGLNYIRDIVDIMGTASGDNLQNYKIEYLRLGSSSWIELFSSDTNVSNGLLFSWDTTSFRNGQCTLRLTAADTNDNVFERKFLINIGNDYQMGWPVRTEGLTDSSPVFADIDGDGDQEVIAISGDNKVYAWHHNGGLVNGWPIYASGLTCGIVYVSSPAVGDLDPFYPGLEIVAAGWIGDAYGASYVYAWHCDGTSVDGWPAKRWAEAQGIGVVNATNSSPALADIDEDGCLEVVVGGWGQRVWAFNHDGSRVNGWPIKVLKIGEIEATPAIGDLDSNYPGLEIVIGTMEVAEGFKSKVYALHNDGTLVPGWPILSMDTIVRSSAALGDLDRDGKLEVVVGAGNGKLYAWRYDGTPMNGFPLQLGEGPIDANYYYAINSSPALGDLDGDGYLEIVVGVTGAWNSKTLWALNYDGSSVDGYWPICATGDVGYSSPAIGDINGDGYYEVLIGGYDNTLVCTHDGVGMRPIRGYGRWSSPAIGDIDGDGDVEAAIGSNCDPLVRVSDLPYDGYDSTKMPWPMFHHDPQHTGCYVDPSPFLGAIRINSGDFYTGSLLVTLDLLAPYMESGVSEMQFSNDGTSWSSAEAYAKTKLWTLTPGDGEKTVYVKFKDAAGNQSDAVSDTIIKCADTTPPTGTISINGGAGYTNVISVTLRLLATDTGSGMGTGAKMQFSNDGTSWSSAEAYATTKSWTLTPGDGEKTVYVKFKDAASNWSDPVSDTIIKCADTTPPTGTIEINDGASCTYLEYVILSLSASDSDSGMGPGAEMQFSNDNVKYYTMDYSNKAYWRLTDGDGIKTVYVKFKDVVGNWSDPVSDTIIKCADTTPPVGTIEINDGSPYTIYPLVTLSLSAADADSGMGKGANMQFSNDGTSWSSAEAYAKTKSWTLTDGDGIKTVYVKFKDVVGNWSDPVSDTIIKCADTTPPVGTIEISGGFEYARSTFVTLCLSATDADSGMGLGAEMQFSNDGTSWSTAEAYAECKEWTLTSGGGVKTVYVKFKDVAGNWSDAVSDTITLIEDTTPPTGIIEINNGFQYTGSTSVTLNLKGTDTDGMVLMMQFSNDNITYTDPEPYLGEEGWFVDPIPMRVSKKGYDTIKLEKCYEEMPLRPQPPPQPPEGYDVLKSWTLTSGDGVKTVYVKFMDMAGNWSDAISDTITLDTAPPSGSIRINDDFAYTLSASVTLNLSARDESGVSEMQFSNNGTDWSTAEAYAEIKPWTLTSGAGEKNSLC